MEFDNAILKFADKTKRTLQFVSNNIKQKCEEIRLRADMPLCLTVEGRTLFVCENSDVCEKLPRNPAIVSNNELQKTLALICDNSVYLHENEIRQGFVSMPHGCRAGVCGVFNADGMLVSVRSINIRIARQVFGCADILLPHTGNGLLIAGPPGSGKTTILRDLIRMLSGGQDGNYYRVAVIDSRGEISGMGSLDLGVCTDVLYTPQKNLGIDIALRTMFPQFIAFDEIGTIAELDSVQNCFNAGVKIITTAHCNNAQDILHRNVTREIIKSKAVSRVAVLPETIRSKPFILCCEDLEGAYC